MSKQTHSFQAEVAELLHLVTHSLYSNKEIFLRELISNASDACDKLRFEALADPALYEGQPELEVRIAFDAAARTLSITDTGIGMSQAEAVEHLGTIAKSGTKAFMARLTGDQKQDAQLIGQFGVGFYSGFIVADRISVESRRAGLPASEGVRWTSAGTGDFEVEPITRAERGTTVTLHLREDATAFANAARLRELIGTYSDHIGLPIKMEGERWQEGAEPGQPGQHVKTGEWVTVNQATALWTRPRKDISDAQAHEFYHQLAHDWEDPLAWSLNRVEGSTEYTQLLFLPSHAPHELFLNEPAHGVKLYVRRVFIMDDAQALLPRYLRFVKGVVDSADLPLNVSRELLQESRDVKAIREGNTRRVLGMIEELARAAQTATAAPATEGQAAPEGQATPDAPTDAPAAADTRFERFYAAFGPVLKEGLGEDRANAERIARLLRYASSTHEGASVSLADYKARMKPGQKAIYYITADTLAAARHSPQLELFSQKGIEVLLMTDRVDEWALNFLTEFDGTPLQSVAKGAIDLGELQDEAEKHAAQQAAEGARALIERLKTALGAQVADVAASARLVDSPACLVSKDEGMSVQLARILRQAGQPVPDVKPVLEINPTHPLVQRLGAAAEATGDAAAAGADFDTLAQVLLDQARLADGILPDDPAAYVRRVNALLMR